MNRLVSIQKIGIVVVLLGIVPSVQAQVDIDTRVGAGADSEITNDGAVLGTAFADDARGLERSMNTFFRTTGPFNERHRYSMFRFDTSGVSGDLTGSGLTVHSVQQSRPIEVYGLLDNTQAGIEDWDESTITFNTAPGIPNLGSETLPLAADLPLYTFLGLWTAPGPTSGDGYDPLFVATTFPEPAMDPDPSTVYTDPANIDANFQSNLDALIAADTNNLVTLMFVPTATSNGLVALRTKEWQTITDPNDPLMTIPNPDFVIAPTLNLPNATMATAENADFDSDGDRDGADFLAWQRGANAAGGLANGDADGSGFVDRADLTIWESQYGVPPLAAISAVPEPTTAILLTIALASGFARRKSRIR